MSLQNYLIINISILFVLFNVIFATYDIFKSTKKCRLKKLSENKLHIAVVITFIFSGISVLFSSSTIIYLTGFTLHYIGLTLLCFLYLSYSQKAFMETKYAMTPSLFRSFICLFIIQILCALFTLSFLLFNRKDISFITHIAFLSVNIISNISFLYIVSRKIYILAHEINDDYKQSVDIVSIAETTNINDIELTTLTMSLSSITKTKSKSDITSKSKSNTKSKYKAKKRCKKNHILSKIVRITVCTLISFIWSNLVNILGVCIYLITTSRQILRVHSLLITIINQTIIIIFLFLTHKHSKRLYMKRCIKIHLCVYGLFARPSNGNNGSVETTQTNNRLSGEYQYSTTNNDTTATPSNVPVLQRDRVTDLDTSSTI